MHDKLLCIKLDSSWHMSFSLEKVSIETRMFVASEQDRILLAGFMAFIENLIGLLEQGEDMTERLGMHMSNHLIGMSLLSLRNMFRDLEAVSGMLEDTSVGQTDSSGGVGTFGTPRFTSTAIGGVGVDRALLPTTVRDVGQDGRGDRGAGRAAGGPADTIAGGGTASGPAPAVPPRGGGQQ